MDISGNSLAASTKYGIATAQENCLYERVVLYVSLILLFLSCIDDGFVGNSAKVIWLISLSA